MKTALLSLSLLFSIASFRSQTYTNDAQLRVSLGLEKRKVFLDPANPVIFLDWSVWPKDN